MGKIILPGLYSLAEKSENLYVWFFIEGIRIHIKRSVFNENQI